MLDVAGRLFGTQRFHEVRMEDIATAAEVGKGTLYRYFADKEELYLSLLERSSRQLMARLRELDERSESCKEELHALVAGIIAFFDEHPHLLDLIQRAEVMREGGAAFPWQAARDELLVMVGNLFRDGTERGEFAVRDPELSTLMLLGGLRSIIRFGKQPRPDDLPARVVDAFLNGANQGVVAVR
jgi:TetR/AcrR family fatty acid metabolism transcriptional regulator